MPPEVLEAMNSAARRFVRLEELHDACGRRIASLLNVPAAMITSGATAAITLGTAAALAGSDPQRIAQLPDTTGLRNEVLIPSWHRDVYDHAIRVTGARLVECASLEDARRKAGPATAMTAFLYFHEPDGPATAEQWIALSRDVGVPALIDIAADVPPVANLWRFARLGYSLTAVSGGKAMRGPQSTGLLLGTEDLIRAARRNASPNDESLGRSMKVSKEELIGMLAAVERFLSLDHDAEWREWQRRADAIAEHVAQIPGVAVQHWIPPVANHAPHLRIGWDLSKLTVEEAVTRLRAGEPSIEVSLDSREDLIVATWSLQDGEERIVAERIAEVLRGI